MKLEISVYSFCKEFYLIWPYPSTPNRQGHYPYGRTRNKILQPLQYLKLSSAISATVLENTYNSKGWHNKLRHPAGSQSHSCTRFSSATAHSYVDTRLVRRWEPSWAPRPAPPRPANMTNTIFRGVYHARTQLNYVDCGQFTGFHAFLMQIKT